MNPKRFAVFAGLTLAALTAALLAVHDRDAAPAAEAGVGQPLIPGLSARLNQVTVLVLSGAGQSVTLARPDPESDRWSIVEKSGHPADAAEVRRAILGLAGAKTVEPRTANPEQYPKLAVDEAGATLITLRGADGAELPSLALGKSVAAASPDHPGSFYARRLAEPQSWLAEGRLPPLAADPMQWLPRELPGMPRARVASVTVARPGAGELAIARNSPETADFIATGLPRATKPRQGKINELAGAAEFLTLEDVAAADPAATPTVTTTLRSFEGEVLSIRISRRDDQSWASFSATLEGANRSPEAARRVAELQARYQGWSYRLPESAARELAPTPDELTEPAKTGDQPKDKRRGG